jgi:lipoprotein
MMKLRRIGIAAVVLPFVLALSSCIRMRQETNVNSRETIEVKADYGVLKEKSQSGGVKDSYAVCQRGMSSVKFPGDFKPGGLPGRQVHRLQALRYQLSQLRRFQQAMEFPHAGQ